MFEIEVDSAVDEQVCDFDAAVLERDHEESVGAASSRFLTVDVLQSNTLHKVCMKMRHRIIGRQGRIQDFHGGGGGAQKIMCAQAQLRAQSPKSINTAGVKDPAISRVLDALSCYLSRILK